MKATPQKASGHLGRAMAIRLPPGSSDAVSDSAPHHACRDRAFRPGRSLYNTTAPPPPASSATRPASGAKPRMRAMVGGDLLTAIEAAVDANIALQVLRRLAVPAIEQR